MGEISLPFAPSLKYQDRHRGGKLVIVVNGRKRHMIFHPRAETPDDVDGFLARKPSPVFGSSVAAEVPQDVDDEATTSVATWGR